MTGATGPATGPKAEIDTSGGPPHAQGRDTDTPMSDTAKSQLQSRHPRQTWTCHKASDSDGVHFVSIYWCDPANCDHTKSLKCWECGRIVVLEFRPVGTPCRLGHISNLTCFAGHGTHSSEIPNFPYFSVLIHLLKAMHYF